MVDRVREGPGRTSKTPGVGPGRNPVYPWDRWFTAGHFVAVRGVDHRTSQSSFAVMVRNEGRRRGLSISLVDDGEAIHVWARPRLPNEGRRGGKGVSLAD